MKYDRLTPDLERQIEYDRAHGVSPCFACPDEAVIRRNPEKDIATLWRPPFVRDAEKILHSYYYNRYADKTQVFSFYRCDDITRRAQHVQLVSRIARNIGKVLGLNLDLIEAIALGHDIGHTPFGHAGERILDGIYFERTGRHFAHNVHSVRVLDGMIPYNISLQTLNGILCHNGEMELEKYSPKPVASFEELDRDIENCYQSHENNLHMIPGTLEGCVVRICDIIAYLGKDRQDAVRAKVIEDETVFPDSPIGTHNAEIINNLTVNIIENSYGHDYIQMDSAYFEALSEAKRLNYQKIYLKDQDRFDTSIRPMMEQLYDRLLQDVKERRTKSLIYRHHIDLVNKSFYRKTPYITEEANQIVVDYIASMTDDYFLDLYDEIYPNNTVRIKIKGYFDEE